MLIIPELETVVLQPARTGTTTVKDAVLKKYPLAFLLYRHMEYKGIPYGYENWRVITQIRDPFDRMLSLYRYMCNPELRDSTSTVWFDQVSQDTENGFDDWLINGKYCFVSSMAGHVNPPRARYSVLYQMPEQRKSQLYYVGTEPRFIHFETLERDVERYLDIDPGDLGHRGKTTGPNTHYSERAITHMRKWHMWDMVHYSKRGDHD